MMNLKTSKGSAKADRGKLITQFRTCVNSSGSLLLRGLYTWVGCLMPRSTLALPEK